MQQLSKLFQGDNRSLRDCDIACLLHMLEQDWGQLGVNSCTVATLPHQPQLIRGAEGLMKEGQETLIVREG